LDQIIGAIQSGVQTRSRLASFYEHYLFVSSIEPTKIEEALMDVDWVNAMHEELNNFTRNEVWELVERPKKHNVIGTKWGLSQQARSRWLSSKKQSKINCTRSHSSGRS
jgi:hypothetical protein